MIPSYIVSLPTEQARRAHAAEECRRYGIPFRFVDAVDTRRISPDELIAQTELPLHRPGRKQRMRRLTAGELGCLLSHQQVYRQIAAQNEPYALILEDDIAFLRDPAPLLDPAALDRLQQQYPFDVLILGYVKVLPEHLHHYYRRFPLKHRAALTLADSGETLNFGTPWRQYGCGAVAYIVSRSGAQKLLDTHPTPKVPADDWPYFAEQHGMHILHTRPAFALESFATRFNSTIRSDNTSHLRIKPLNELVRRIKGALKNFAMNTLGMK